jgi:predicted outer membrane repeat protein
MRPHRLNIFLHTLISSTFIITPWLVLLLLAVAGSSQVVLADAPEAICTPPIQPVTPSNPMVITNCSNQTQLQTALANGGHITFNCGVAPVTIPVTSPLVTSETQDIVVDGGGLITLDGLNSNRILVKPFTPGADVDKNKGNDLTLQNIRFINGRAPAATQNQDGNARGGAVWVTSPGTKLHLINATFENNRTTSLTDEDNQGGAVFAANIYETIITGSVFDNNEAGNGGAFGGIATGLIVYNSHFTNNKASDNSSGGIVRGHGGAIHLDGVSNNFNPSSNNVVDICGSVFEGNTAVRGGGAIKTTISDNLGTKATYQDSSFINNRLVGVPPVEGHGGAIYHIEDDFAGGTNEDNIEIRDSTFAGNYAYRQGGGAWILVQGRGRVVNSTFTGNEASQAGSNRVGQGGALILAGVIDVVNTTFANNFATFQGGAIFAGGSSTVTLANTLFYRNHLDPTHTNPVTSEFQGYHTNRPLTNGGNNLQFPRTKEPDFPHDINNLITSPASAIIFADPLLGPLADNGGPQQTMALGAGSPAINAGNLTACPATDQRGIGRPQGSGCDIGAYEVVVTLNASPNLVAIDDGAFTLTVTGDGFTVSSQVLWNGQPVPTTFIDSTRLQAAVSSVILGNVPGQVQVTVNNSPLAAATVLIVQSLTRGYLPIILK